VKSHYPMISYLLSVSKSTKEDCRKYHVQNKSKRCRFYLFDGIIANQEHLINIIDRLRIWNYWAYWYRLARLLVDLYSRRTFLAPQYRVLRKKSSIFLKQKKVYYLNHVWRIWKNYIMLLLFLILYYLWTGHHHTFNFCCFLLSSAYIKTFRYVSNVSETSCSHFFPRIVRIAQWNSVNVL